jgi:hypothetical protein
MSVVAFIDVFKSWDELVVNQTNELTNLYTSIFTFTVECTNDRSCTLLKKRVLQLFKNSSGLLSGHTFATLRVVFMICKKLQRFSRPEKTLLRIPKGCYVPAQKNVFLRV